MTGQELYYPFYGSALTVILTGVFALWKSRPKAQTDKFSALVEAYSQFNKEFREDNERLRRENNDLSHALQDARLQNSSLREAGRVANEKAVALEQELLSLDRLEARLAALKKQTGGYRP